MTISIHYVLLAGALSAAGTVQAQDDVRARQAATAPSLARVGISATGRSLALASAGFFVGAAIDFRKCKKRNPDRTGFIFDFCAFTYEDATVGGWIGMSIAGAAWSAANGAIARGCPRQHAITRALGGAIVGALPSIVVGARESDKWPPPRTAVVVAGPLLSAVGATVAIASCHR